MGDEVGCRGAPSGPEGSSTVTEDVTSSGGGDGGRADTFTGYTQTEWTDEKHSLFLNSIEASFINRLYGRDYHVRDSASMLPRAPKIRNSPASKMCNLYSGQFKVQRRGCWENFEYGCAKSKRNKDDEPLTIPRNPWIQHFSAISANKSLTDNQLATSAELNLAVSSGCQRDKFFTFRDASISEWPARCVDVDSQENCVSSAEVSDQNFVDDDPEWPKKLPRSHRKKRARSTGESLGHDQVVPHKKCRILPSDYARASNGRKDAKAIGQQTEDLKVLVSTDEKCQR